MAGLLRLVSTVATIIVALGFVLFAIDATDESSAETVARIQEPGARAPQKAESRDGFRGLVDDANDVLLAPFDGLVSSWRSEWARHGVSALLGILLYGFGLRMLANAAPRLRRHKPLGWEVPR